MSDQPRRSLLDKVIGVLGAETAGVHPKLHAVKAVGHVLPTAGKALVAPLLRGAGFTVGEGTVVDAMPTIHGGEALEQNLHIGQGCIVGVGCTFDLEERITIEDDVTIGHQVMILTSTHELGPKEHRAGPVTRNPVTIKRGAWVQPRSIVLPGVTVGEGAVVTAGSLVNKDVPAHTRVAGSPARQVEAYEPQPPPPAEPQS